MVRVANVSLLLDEATKISENEYAIPDISMRSYENCKLVSAYLTNTFYNIRQNGREYLQVTFYYPNNIIIPTTAAVEYGSYTSNDIETLFTQTNSLGIWQQLNDQVSQSNPQLQPPNFYGVYSKIENKMTFISSVPFIISFPTGNPSHMGEIIGFKFGSYSSSPASGIYSTDAYKITAPLILNAACDKQVLISCKTMRDNHIALTSQKVLTAQGERIIYSSRQGLVLALPVDLSQDGSIVELNNPRMFENIFKFGGTIFELHFANGEKCDLQGGYLTLTFELF